MGNGGRRPTLCDSFNIAVACDADPKHAPADISRGRRAERALECDRNDKFGKLFNRAGERLLDRLYAAMRVQTRSCEQMERISELHASVLPDMQSWLRQYTSTQRLR